MTYKFTKNMHKSRETLSFNDDNYLLGNHIYVANLIMFNTYIIDMVFSDELNLIYSVDFIISTLL